MALLPDLISFFEEESVGETFTKGDGGLRAFLIDFSGFFLQCFQYERYWC